jgi:hypothetical protein
MQIEDVEQRPGEIVYWLEPADKKYRMGVVMRDFASPCIAAQGVAESVALALTVLDDSLDTLLDE